jgi:ACS family tartrate transporter-like MFS transporter
MRMVPALSTHTSPPDIPPVERETMRLVTRRLLPILMVCYFFAYLDRVNVGFAALSMNAALGFSPSVYGFGSGIFFLGFFVFELPSNLLLARFGARVWIARIMVTWGVISALTAWITGPHAFYTVRFLLGVAEAGFFPGVILYLTWWFPSGYRARIIAMFMAAIPISNIFGSLLSGTLLGLDGWLGVAGWRWLFIIEAVPPIVLGAVVHATLTDRPNEADWLRPEQRDWLIGQLDRERRKRESIRRYTLWQALLNRQILLLSLVYFGATFAGYALVLFQPQIVHRLAGSFGMTGLINAIPYGFAACAMVYWGRHSDRTGERSHHAMTAYLVAAAGLVATALMTDPVLTMAMLVIAAMGQTSAYPVVWTLPTAMLSGTAAAGGIALINALGNLGGFFGPTLLGFIKDVTHNDTIGLAALALGPIMSAIIIGALGHNRQLEQAGPRTLE